MKSLLEKSRKNNLYESKPEVSSVCLLAKSVPPLTNSSKVFSRLFVSLSVGVISYHEQSSLKGLIDKLND